MNTEELRIMFLPKMQEKFRERMGIRRIYDQFWCPRSHRDINEFFCEKWDCRKGYVDHCNGIDSTAIRIPLPIDLVNSTRGLWGMLDWNHWECRPTQADGRMTMYFDGRWKFTETPTLALLKALALQWGIDLEERHE